MSQNTQKYGSQIPWKLLGVPKIVKSRLRSRASYPKILSVNLWHQKIQRYSQQNLWGDIVLDYTK